MIELRYPETRDSAEFFRILNEGNFQNYYATIPDSVEAEMEWIKRRVYKRENNLEYNYTITYEKNVVGGCEIRIDSENPHIGEIGYFIDRNYFNRGIASEAVKSLENIAFEKLGLARLEIRMSTENKASERVALKNGFEKEGLLRKIIKFKGEYFDNFLYSKVKDQ